MHARAAAVTLKRFASYLAEDDILADDNGVSVLKHVKRTKVDDDVRQPLSSDDLDRLIAAAGRPGSRDRTLIVFAAGTGLRANELREARTGDLDLARGCFTVRPETSKFGRERVVNFHPAVGRELDRYLRESRIAANAATPLFPTRTGEPFDVDGFAKLFARLRERSGIRTFSAHILRHTWATELHERARCESPRAQAARRMGTLGDGRAIQPPRSGARSTRASESARPLTQNRLWSAALRSSQPPFALGVENERRAQSARRH